MQTMRGVRVHSIADASDMHAAQARLIAPSVAHQLAGVFKSLSDPTRLRIISMVSEREFCVTDLAAALEMEQSTISHQLRDMRRLGLVSFRREGRHIFYRLDDPHCGWPAICIWDWITYVAGWSENTVLMGAAHALIFWPWGIMLAAFGLRKLLGLSARVAVPL